MSPRVRSGLITAALATFAVVVGCHELGKPSLWFDEAFSVDMATRPFDSFVSLAADREANQSLYYLALRIWPFHDSEFGVSCRRFSSPVSPSPCCTTSAGVFTTKRTLSGQ